MTRHVLFIQGGGSEEDYEADAKLVSSLREHLGNVYLIHYPRLVVDESEPDFGRRKQIGSEISKIDGELILVGHSLGASMVLKYLSECTVEKKIGGVFLLSTPFWAGDEEWKQGLKLSEDFAAKLPKGAPVFLYHCRDDEEVSFNDLNVYSANLPQATVRMLTSGGHQYEKGLSVVAKDIASLKK